MRILPFICWELRSSNLLTRSASKATKCDLPRHIKREDMIDDAIKYGTKTGGIHPLDSDDQAGFQGYYETSAKTAENVQELFHDVVRQMRINRASPEERAKLIKVRLILVCETLKPFGVRRRCRNDPDWVICFRGTGGRKRSM